eukprot:TRINITY_DN67878_c11_g2_i1.p1 TRINITY_DN67878_c11_g2~~TRINITY_DN67878_c11_g2_i1.p1  ORF type:complete len:734 (+),score=24.03 TRINITY_DN67878_c11_g2_i1:66-2267(+)
MPRPMPDWVQAMQCGDVSFLEQHKGELVNVLWQGRTPLMVACTHGHIPVVSYLLDNGITHEPPQPAWTPLMLAVDNGHLELVKLLVSIGHDPNSSVHTTGVGSSVLHLAAYDGDLPMVQWLCTEAGMCARKERKDSWTPLLLASLFGHLPVVQWLVETGRSSPATELTSEGFTSLGVAASKGKLEIVKFLVEGDWCDPVDEPLNSLGETPLLDAISGSHDETARYLFFHQIPGDPDRRYIDSFTPLLLATKMGNTELVEWMLQHGQPDYCSLSETAKSGHTVWSIAAERGNLPLLRLFGLPPTPEITRHALLSAAGSDQLAVVQYLLSKTTIEFTETLREQMFEKVVLMEETRRGEGKVLVWLLVEDPHIMSKTTPARLTLPKKLIDTVVETGNLNAIKFLKSDVLLPADVLVTLTSNRHREAAAWLVEKAGFSPFEDFAIFGGAPQTAIAAAVINSDFELVRLFLNTVRPKQLKTELKNYYRREGTSLGLQALEVGALNIAKYLHGLGLFDVNKERRLNGDLAAAVAASRGDTAALKWLQHVGCKTSCSAHVLANAAENGWLPCVQYLFEECDCAQYYEEVLQQQCSAPVVDWLLSDGWLHLYLHNKLDCTDTQFDGIPVPLSITERMALRRVPWVAEVGWMPYTQDHMRQSLLPWCSRTHPQFPKVFHVIVGLFLWCHSRLGKSMGTVLLPEIMGCAIQFWDTDAFSPRLLSLLKGRQRLATCQSSFWFRL